MTISLRYAVELGLPRDAFVACLDAHRFAPAVEADLAQGRALGVRCHALVPHQRPAA